MRGWAAAQGRRLPLPHAGVSCRPKAGARAETASGSDGASTGHRPWIGPAGAIAMKCSKALLSRPRSLSTQHPILRSSSQPEKSCPTSDRARKSLPTGLAFLHVGWPRRSRLLDLSLSASRSHGRRTGVPDRTANPHLGSDRMWPESARWSRTAASVRVCTPSLR